MKNKYNWSDIPAHLIWMATDLNGFKHGYSEEPICKDHLDFWDGDDCTQLGFSEFKGDWKDSLEERPK